MQVAPPMPPGVSWEPGSPSPPAAVESASRERQKTKNIGQVTRVIYDGRTHYFAPDPWSRPLRAGHFYERGIASFYGPQEQGNYTADGERFDYHKMTAAHRTLPMGTRIRVTDLRTHRSVVVRINDRGPFWPGRILDLSMGAAEKIHLDGLDPVNIKILSLPKPLPPGRYTVQVGWFTSSRQLKHCRRLMAHSADYRVIEFHSREGSWLRYDKRAYFDRGTAITVVNRLREKDFPAYVVRLN